MRLARVNSSSGKILDVGVYSGMFVEDINNTNNENVFIEVTSDSTITPQTHYYDKNEAAVQIRPSMELAINSTDLIVNNYLTITNIPIGTVVKYPGGEITVDDGEIEWTTEDEGAYTFRLINFPYIEETVHATFTEA